VAEENDGGFLKQQQGAVYPALVQGTPRYTAEAGTEATSHEGT
jgi:hypothetical protein